MNNFFIASKPLQYFNITNINTDGKKNLLMVNHFINFEAFIMDINQANYWDDIKTFKKEFDAYDYLIKNCRDGDNVFIDNDYGIKKTLYFLFSSKINLYTYEEGIGAYRTDLLKSKSNSKIVRFVLKLIGYKEYFGGNYFTQGIYLYDHNLHRKLNYNYNKKRLSFKDTFVVHLSRIEEHFYSQVEYISKLLLKFNKKNHLHLYLTSWKFNERIEEYIDRNDDNSVWILKPHPHIKNDINHNMFDYILPGEVLIEIFINKLIKEKINLTIYHEGSSAVIPFKNQALIKEIKI